MVSGQERKRDGEREREKVKIWSERERISVKSGVKLSQKKEEIGEILITQ